MLRYTHAWIYYIYMWESFETCLKMILGSLLAKFGCWCWAVPWLVGFPRLPKQWSTLHENASWKQMRGRKRDWMHNALYFCFFFWPTLANISHNQLIPEYYTMLSFSVLMLLFVGFSFLCFASCLPETNSPPAFGWLDDFKASLGRVGLYCFGVRAPEKILSRQPENRFSPKTKIIWSTIIFRLKTLRDHLTLRGCWKMDFPPPQIEEVDSKNPWNKRWGPVISAIAICDHLPGRVC